MLRNLGRPNAEMWERSSHFRESVDCTIDTRAYTEGPPRVEMD
jgi:hypothetical protein